MIWYGRELTAVAQSCALDLDMWKREGKTDLDYSFTQWKKM